ncbi:MAG: NAD(P)/FAD-dependent oxidoreductase [Acidobacteriota bacterium]
MTVCVVGGGMLGITLALDLARAGRRTLLVEAADRLGGLAADHDYGAFRWDRFYHCILPGDVCLLGLLDEVGLSGELVWRRSSTGFLGGGAVHPMNGPADLWRFPLLGPADKLRLALTSLWAARFARPGRLERIPASRWLRRLCGHRAYRVFWEPLLRAKFGVHADRVAAVFLWATLRRLAGARGSTVSREQLGHVRGGYATILAALGSALERAGVEVLTGTPVERIEPRDGGTGCRLRLAGRGAGTRDVDHVVFTAPSRLARRVCAPVLAPRIDAWERENPTARVYLGVLCQVLALPERLTPHYVVNIGQRNAELTGIIEMTNIVDPDEETAGWHLVYLPRYVDADDPLFDAEDDAVSRLLLDRGLRRLFPDAPIDAAAYRGVHRARHVQPLPLATDEPRPDPGPLACEPPFQIVNTARLRCATLNNDEVVALAREAARAIAGGRAP